MTDLIGVEALPEPSITTRTRWYLNDMKYRAVAKWRAACDRLKWLGA